MTPGARISAAIECLDLVFEGIPAEKSLTGWARRSRFAGSKDRAAVRDHVFDALRRRDSFAALGGGLTGRGVMIGLVQADPLLSFDVLFSGEGHAPEALNDVEAAHLAIATSTGGEAAAMQARPEMDVWDMPDWCSERLLSAHASDANAIANALKTRAPVDLRVNQRRANLQEAIVQLQSEDISAETSAVSSTALRVTKNARRVKLSKPYLEGFVELQDAGSQALVQALPLKPCTKILDYCAGGGGKALAMADATDAKIFAHDVQESRMSDIPVRAARAGVSIECIPPNSLHQHGSFDLVLCDAPCSGSGAWRRSPDAKWRLTQERFQELIDIQFDILRSAQAFVSPSGYLAYATCSLFAEENEEQVNQFLHDFPKFDEITTKSWTPLDGCDGFYVSVMQLKA